IAGEDDELAIVGPEPAQGLAGEGDDLVRGARPVRHPRLVAEVDRRLGRELAAQLAQHGESADAGIEYADGQVGCRRHRFRCWLTRAFARLAIACDTGAFAFASTNGVCLL